MPPYPPGPAPFGHGPAPAPRRRHPVRRYLVPLAVTAVAVAVGIGVGRAFGPSQTSSDPAAPFVRSGGGSVVGASDVTAKVDPTLVIINTTLGYQGGRAAGTGIVIGSNGEILTNNHVIEGATAITATDVGNGRTYTATVVGYDQSADLAVLHLSNASGLATAKLGDSSKVAVGDAVAAVGNAGGTGSPTTATGSVTALDRSITASDPSAGTAEQLTGMIEVDADVQAGDSGGALVDSTGAVIGIDTAGSDTGGYQQQAGSAGFAIPIDTALPLARQIMAGQAGADVHIGPTAFLGVEVAAASGGDSGSGAPVAGVITGSPAAQAGLTQGDDITAVDGRAVDTPAALSTILAGRSVGSHVTVQWTDTDGASHSATVTLVAGPAA
ncbi:S1C family serine protease [Kitasatospora sp. NPDC058965]|uniref:S1C family serine protease n=1 Tax=Kitasatospora sp. NPDC058965 TaxID=3346682 RepID=UPI003691C8E3